MICVQFRLDAFDLSHRSNVDGLHVGRSCDAVLNSSHASLGQIYRVNSGSLRVIIFAS
jgi:hypothetical protein